jgi:hypothetical protein
MRGRLLTASRTALSACPSASGLCTQDTYASMPWVSASSPVAAARSAGMVDSSRGSVTEISGTSARPMIVTFTLLAVSVMMQNWETSAPVPAVDGIISSGGIGRVTGSTPA